VTPALRVHTVSASHAQRMDWNVDTIRDRVLLLVPLTPSCPRYTTVACKGMLKVCKGTALRAHQDQPSTV
jgi:hypothetical protein